LDEKFKISAKPQYFWKKDVNKFAN
jgi:hypothetical protein